MSGQHAGRQKYPRFRTHMFAVLAGFIGVALLLIWFFQIVLLGPMYEFIKMQELKDVSRQLARDPDDTAYRELSDHLAQHTNICISVYKISGQTAAAHAISHIHGSCFIHNVSSEVMLNRLYAGALEHGYYTERMKDSFLIAAESTADVPESIVVSTLAQGKDSQWYLILLNAEIEPVGTTADTLRVQLGLITVVLLILAAAAAGFFSLKMSKSVMQMSAEANKLAMGNYDVHFDGGYTRETAELGDALNYAAGELSALDSMRKELLANISHDLRTPLTMIAGYSEMMRDIPGEMTGENIQIVIDETHRLSTLVNDILDLSKLQNGSHVLNCAVVSVTETVRATLERYSKLCTQDGYTIEFLCDREAYIYADTTKILQVVYNLVNNAVNYTGEDKKVTIRQICYDGVCRIEVIDTGEGIPPEQLSLIWDRYYKVKNYYKRAVSGSGLGLSIVKNILLLHGAKFGVQSEVGTGSTFWFELPEVEPVAEDKENL